jgi:uncharacterized protein YlxP (DUF503 family)
MLVDDEVHNLLAGSARHRRMALNLLEILANHFACSIVGVDTQDAHAATQIDPQVS